MENETGFVLSEKVYQTVKWLVQIVLPAFGTFYLALDKFVDVPNEEAVVGITVLLATFLGTILGISSKNYNNSDARFVGDVIVTDKPDGGKTMTLELNGDPYDILDMTEANFKVKHQ